IAGPIMRAKNLLTQVINPRQINWQKIQEGTYLIFWGLFQKIFIADNLAKIVDPLFKRQSGWSCWEVCLGAYAFAFQLYCDFAGYSNMARGLGKLMGFEI